ncbi:redox-sensitive transcriptional activator SoxR [Zymomonas mobilis subsp. mobilis ZM4 = ATCC 31821]|uniref:redox-sensitive transcriptional activator SoxR n=1 Tax=Zymomonas mobilis TaxID=542 RepID=UPI0002D8222B|nr:redox-sensitive transcriptional activator SoxR [Zymomonas mobilis]QIZ64059.1 redox-sensitive transcriptional activator SoxR [Zymomonas mobilis subsp. mobilis ZM4 = ATCC 31821]UBQ08006.1 redox-sensitive transcriptional activator SoxR [Zymomonas mobilis]HCE37118.1 redox-sensitive transcriptional activator SoxR [Zymomonas mobilis]
MKTKLSAYLSVGEVAQRSGVAVSTLHFYEAKGLISSIRTHGNQRRYARDVLRRVSLIKTAQGLGIGLSEILTLLAPFPATQKLTATDVSHMVSLWKVMLRERIQRLNRFSDHIDKCIGCGCLSREDCPLVNDNDHLREQGSGAVLLS